jgi:hypothetical protein
MRLNEGLGRGSAAILSAVKNAPNDHLIRVDPVDSDKAVAAEGNHELAFLTIDRPANRREHRQHLQMIAYGGFCFQ